MTMNKETREMDLTDFAEHVIATGSLEDLGNVFDEVANAHDFCIRHTHGENDGGWQKLLKKINREMLRRLNLKRSIKSLFLVQVALNRLEGGHFYLEEAVRLLKKVVELEEHSLNS